MAKTEIDSKAAEAANEEQVKETETQAEAEVVKEKEASSEDAQAPEGEKEKKGFFSLFHCPSKSIWLHNTLFFYGLHKSYLPAQKTEDNLFWQLNPHNIIIIMPILPKKIFR